LHVDAYRIENEIDLLPLDLDDELHVPGTVLVVEWPENVPGWLSNRPSHRLIIEMRKYGRKVTYEKR
jgi:tRNA A37 threonylcarbamoyladenosine biosynthesis protein TsaE